MREFKAIFVFVVLIAVALYVLYIWQGQRDNERALEAAGKFPAGHAPVAENTPSPAAREYPTISDEERLRLNEAWGVPADYPLEIIPLIEGMEVLETERGDAETEQGEPMDRWLVRGVSDASQADIAGFYKGLMEQLEFAQTMYVSIPGDDGADYGMNYADPNFEVRFEIERRKGDTQTRIKIELFRVVAE